MIIIKTIFVYIKNNHDINNIKILKRFPKIDEISWQSLYILCLFRMISYNIEYINSSLENFVNDNYKTDNNLIEKRNAQHYCERCSNGYFCLKCLENIKLEKDKDFSFLNYICYIFYPHLLYSGPIINYNSFIFQINNHEQSKHNLLFIFPKILYLLKYIILFLLMELYNHYIYSITIFKNYNYFKIIYYLLI